MVKTLNYKEELIKRLKKPEHSIAYLNAALMDEDPRIFLLALKDVLEAYGSLTDIAKKAELNRESMYKTLSGKRDPHLSTVTKILKSIGIELKTSAKP
jgi:probable addiction module antidote protein